MKQFSCGDVVPGCKAVFRAEQEQMILSLVAKHAAKDHGIKQVPMALVEQVLSRVVDLPIKIA